MRWYRTVASCATVMLAGCVVGPDYSAPRTRALDRWSEPQPVASSRPATMPAPTTSPAPDLACWWHAFSDPELEALIARVASANLDLRIAEARIREARALGAVVAGSRYPQVGSEASFARQQPSANGQLGRLGSGLAGLLGNKLDSAYELYQAGFDASWELDLFGGVRRSIEAARANEEMAIEDRRDLLISLEAEVARNYIELRAAQRRLVIARETLAAEQSTLELVRDKRSVGAVTQLDVSRATAQVAMSETRIPVFTRQIRLSIHALTMLLAADADELGGRLCEATPVPLTPGDIPPMGIPQDLVRRRPDVRRAERTLAAATARIGVASADLYPRLSLTGRIGMEATRFSDFGDWDSRAFGFGPVVRWPVFQGGRIRANIRVQDARQEQALVGYERVLLAAIREVEDAVVTYTSEQARRKSLADCVEASREAVELARLGYDEGATDLLAVLDAQRTLYAARDALAEADQNVVLSLVALYKALGGGWDPAGNGCEPCPELNRLGTSGD